MIDEATISQDRRDIKSKIRLEKCSRGSYVIALAIDTAVYTNNIPQAIPCTKGDHVNNVVYDVPSDCYFAHCVDYFLVGSIPVSYKLKIEGAFCWETFCPLPEKVIRRHIGEEGCQRLDQWKKKYKKTKYSIRYLQITKVF